MRPSLVALICLSICGSMSVRAETLVRRAGDYVYLSGVVVSREVEGPRTPETFKKAARQAFTSLRASLLAFGADLSDVVSINSFHDWSAPEFQGDRNAQFIAFQEVEAEFMPSSRPAWTAIGTTGLLREAGIVDVQMIAYAPRALVKRSAREAGNDESRHSPDY